jgi:uroporphyrin-III C-methyltransferase/precorrin-2 dehydrogenase/sirohydrochlorin ferrochelatase
MADRVTLHSLPIFVRLAGRPVMLIGDGDAADAKRRLLERADAVIVGEDAEAVLAIVALDDPDAIVARLKARSVLVNAVDRPDLCDFTLPAIVDRSPVIVAMGTGGASAGLAAALRQRLEGILPAGLGRLAEALHAARANLRERFPNNDDRRRAIGVALQQGGTLDPFAEHSLSVRAELVEARVAGTPFDKLRVNGVERITLTSLDPDDLTLRQARALAQADRVLHAPGVPSAILDRARADAPRIVSPAPPVEPGNGLTVYLEMAR